MRNTDITKSLIYVADDVAANRALLKAILARDGGLDVRQFEDGQALLDAIDVLEPDLIFLDLRMPLVDGFEVLRQLQGRRSNDSYVPVIVLTGESSPDARRMVLEAGANDYVTKPFDAGEVMLRARNLLETRRLHLALRTHNADLAGQVASAARDLLNREREWAGVAMSLSRLEVRDSAEATAQAICDELAKISGLTSVVIVGLDAAGQVVPLAHDGSTDVGIDGNRPLPRDLTSVWHDRIGATPWIGPWESGFGGVVGSVPDDSPTAMAIIPLRTSKGVLGGLSAATSVSNGGAYLAERLPILESFGALASALLAPGILDRQERGIVRSRLELVLSDGSFTPVFQPVVELATGRTVGYEALTRFDDGMRPDRRFADAGAVGLGYELEAATLTAALAAAVDLPADVWLSVNVSPGFLMDGSHLRRSLRDTNRPMVLEITEHVAIENYEAFREAVASLGVDLRYAVDDAGAGFSSFRHILELRPDFVKLDIGLVRDINADEVRQALVAGIVYFARRSGCRLVAEGIETTSERTMLQALGIDLGQGFLLGRPASLGARRDAQASRPAPALKASHNVEARQR
jgi:EAL domain-containing protein (putative c-di-GMP-specific phosphodiesterase class I)/DNA-binding response OmpR family regulator